MKTIKNSVGQLKLTKRLLCIAFIFYGFQPLLNAADLPATIQQIKPSIVGIATVQPTRTPPGTFLGTGFVIADGLHVVTNAHVIPPALDSEKKETLNVTIGLGDLFTMRQAQVIAMDSEHDLVLLKMGGDPLPALQIGDSAKVQEGQSLAFTGFPLGTVLGAYPVTHQGIVSAITPIAVKARNSNQLEMKLVKRLNNPYLVFQLDATAYPGNSGSPVYDPNTGVVYGVINMVFIKGTKESALSQPSGISYAIPSSYIKDLLNNAKQK